jgi:hypothetical protein
MLLTVLFQIKKQASLVANRLVVRKVIENLAMWCAAILKLGTDLLPPEVENRVVYLRNSLLVGNHPSRRPKIFYISSTLFPSPKR